MKKTLLLAFGIAILTVGCGAPASVSRTVKFSPKNDEITTTPSLKEYLETNPNPKIVLRTSSRLNTDNVTEKEKNSYLYNAIESELLKSGFVVRDRQLFDKIVTNSDNNNNYENLKEKSDTDLIIELTNLDRSIEYQTNKYYDTKGREKTSSVLAQKSYYGATIEFKVIMINTNEFAGIYKFNYVPCIDGCAYGPTKRMTRRELDEIQSYEAVEENRLIKFVKNATNQLVAEMRN
ncbi:hypothetical protein ITJ86_17095 [Winogradskyella sp. F6397]|uniref:Lipoprotein n=1 Tax=Winogradskyella marina TaxID=2785530 RepID=A0ABS0EMF3_9FLAO|nr:hypothetical protein [Winogradskyella marina]MBF8151618.1 hypothetical protein [Winogradskyella marina]